MTANDISVEDCGRSAKRKRGSAQPKEIDRPYSPGSANHTARRIADSFIELIDFVGRCADVLQKACPTIDGLDGSFFDSPEFLGLALPRRSEERRVGKECRSRWSPYH